MGVIALLAIASGSATASADRARIEVTTLHFAVPDGHGGRCDVVGDLYVPPGASAAKPVPALLGTNWFAGSKDGVKPMARMFAARGYAVLAYSGLGFGGSGCRIGLDSPRPDGTAASRLIDFLGGAPGIGFLDRAHRVRARSVDFVVKDAQSRDGVHRAHDPRVGMFGGSYGGHVQFAAAAVDPRLDTIMPMATWNDLAYVDRVRIPTLLLQGHRTPCSTWTSRSRRTVHSANEGFPRS